MAKLFLEESRGTKYKGLFHNLFHNSLAKFNDDVKKLYYIFKKNQYPEGLLNKVVKSYLDKVHNSNNSTPPKDTTIIYFKLPFLNLSNFSQRKVRMLVKRYCKDLQIKLSFTSFKIKNLLTAKIVFLDRSARI